MSYTDTWDATYEASPADTDDLSDGAARIRNLKINVRERLSPVGTIIPYGGGSVPTNWLECNGASLLRASYADLFAAIGTAWGAADGTHFNLPDLRGRFMRGWDHGAGRDQDAADRTACNAGGATADNVGSVQVDEVGPHTHPDRRDINEGTGVGGNVIRDGNEPTWTEAGAASTGEETRPINANVLFIIRY